MPQIALEQALQIALQRQKSGRFADAEPLYRQILAQQPNHPDANYYLGVLLGQLGHYPAAIDFILKAIPLLPPDASVHNNLGEFYRRWGKLDEAVAAFRRSIELNPRYPEALGNLGIALRDRGNTDEAIAVYRQAIALKPRDPELHSNLGNALLDNGRTDDAISAYRQAIALRPASSEAHLNLGKALRLQGNPEAAIPVYRHAISLNPASAEAHFSLGLTLLSKGDFAAGWEEYEWRWQCQDYSPLQRKFPQQQWDGSPLNNRTILLHTEQGLGDALQFIRYMPLVVQHGGRVIVECQSELRRLLQGMSHACPVVTRGDPLPAFDIHCPLLSLPRIFHTTLATIPQNVPYLHAGAQDITPWRTRLAGHSHSKVGLVWSGNPTHKNDRNRSIPLAAFAPLAKVPGVRFYSLQKGAAPHAQRPAADFELIDWMHEAKDFADTAAFIATLDLVIAVDTAVAHLAGAMGKPVWTLLPFAPDWRWLQDRDDTPWYPTMRLFRQPSPGDWNSVMHHVFAALTEFRHPPQ